MTKYHIGTGIYHAVAKLINIAAVFAIKSLGLSGYVLVVGSLGTTMKRHNNKRNAITISCRPAPGPRSRCPSRFPILPTR